MLNIDYTLLVQIANFLFLLILLNIIAYRPIRNILNKRNEEISAFQHSIEDYQEKASQREEDLRTNIVTARKDGMKQREGFKGEGQEEEKAMLREAHAAAEIRIEEAKNEIQGSLDAVRESLQSEVEGFSQQLAEKILGRSM
jgi:F-type H+-transporting ATPase subunit b